MSEESSQRIKHRPECEMPECLGRGDRSHVVETDEGEIMKMCEGCLNDGWSMHVEVID